MKMDFVATKNAPLFVGAGMSKECGTVSLKEEGFIFMHQESSLTIDKLVIFEKNPDYDILAAGDDGENGEPAQEGENGCDGGEIRIEIKELSDSIKIVTRGGNGGAGGFGGAGGDGKDGVFNGKGAAGGNGGNGGNGGCGGKGPHVILQYDSTEEVEIEAVNLCAKGGRGGRPGQGGCGGRNGDLESVAVHGKTGEAGMDGKSGTKGTVEVIKMKGE